MTSVALTEADLHQLHRVQLEMLLEFDRVCRQLGVAYQLGAGSLLGAVRHGGFIPWDDDIDVVMLRADYQRFLRQAPPLLDARFFVQTWRSDPGFTSFFAKLRRHDSVYHEAFRQKARHHHGIYIDIFPFDPVWPERRWWRGLLGVVQRLRRVLDRLQHLANHPSGGRLAPWRPAWQRLIGPIAQRGLAALPPAVWLAAHAALLRSLAVVPSRQVVCLASSGALDGGLARLLALVRPIAEFERTVPLMFEGQAFPATAAYHQALTRLYGDYRVLPPPGRRMPGHPVVAFRLPGQAGSPSA